MALELSLMFAVLAAGIIACMAVSGPARLVKVPVVSAVLAWLAAVPVAWHVYHGGAQVFFNGTLLVDMLAVYHILLVNTIFLFSAVYATEYYRVQITSGALNQQHARRYSMLWQAFHAVLLLVLLCNNVGLMWVAVETTTLVSAFLIISETDTLSIEAMWKYLLVCSVGITFAFMGTILTVAAARGVQPADSVYLLSHLTRHPELINPRMMLLAFIFIVIGYGTKAGLAPMHTWLPDAHSQAPTPVSAVFSGVMLNAALYCIMRYLPVARAVAGSGEARSILLLFGFLSMVFAMVFVSIQRDMKRFLAYCSVEHIGIITIGLAVGGLGTVAALLHTVNHSFAKTLSFFAAGRIGRAYGTRDMSVIRGAVGRVPYWGVAFFISVLALIGVAPFAVFYSEFLIVKEAFFNKSYFVVGLFLFAALAIFIGSLKHVLDVSFGDSGTAGTEPPVPAATRRIDAVTVTVLLALVLLLGVWIPGPLMTVLERAAAIIEHGAVL